MDLFDYMRTNTMEKEAPLASRMRPATLDEVVGQQHIIGKDKLLYRAIKADKISSVIFYGPPGTGKTLLAQRLLQTYRCPCLSMDLLKMGLIRSGNTRLTPEDDRELESYLWPIVREIIKTAIENRQDLIVEGCYVPPRWSQDFTPSYLREIRFCCLVMTKAYIETHFADIQKYACAAERRIDDSTCTKETLLLDNAHYQQMCETWGYPCILIDQAYEVDIPL